jgi:hypothetical protein
MGCVSSKTKKKARRSLKGPPTGGDSARRERGLVIQDQAAVVPRISDYSGEQGRGQQAAAQKRAQNGVGGCEENQPEAENLVRTSSQVLRRSSSEEMRDMPDAAEVGSGSKSKKERLLTYLGYYNHETPYDSGPSVPSSDEIEYQSLLKHQ